MEANEQSLTVQLANNAVVSLNNQRAHLKNFIGSQLVKDSDFGVVPGTNKSSLYKPGAEKLANIFQLGTRVLKNDKQIDFANNFAMFEVTIETFHIPTGKSISQCTAIANSQEVKYRSRAKYEYDQKTRQKKKVSEEPTPIGDLLNTLIKMAQKRAYVGAVLIATGASDFFTTDIEDMPDFIEDEPEKKITSTKVVTKDKPASAPQTQMQEPPAHMADEPPPAWESESATVKPQAQAVSDAGSFVIPFGKHKGLTLIELGKDEAENYGGYLVKTAKAEGKEMRADAKLLVEKIQAFLAS